MYTTTQHRPLGSNDFSKFSFTVHEPSYAWVKYAALALAVVALRFLCCA